MRYAFLVPLLVACNYINSFQANDNISESDPVPGEVDVAKCSDGILNQEEKGVDCGGPCAACDVLSTGLFVHPGALDAKQELDLLRPRSRRGYSRGKASMTGFWPRPRPDGGPTV